MTRRAFCFLFGAGVGAAALGIVPTLQVRPLINYGHKIIISRELLEDAAIDVSKWTLEGYRPDLHEYTFTGQWVATHG